MQIPTISIITVTYNPGFLLQKTIDSVVCQSYAAIEYIVVDGASTDETLSTIQKNQAHIQQWISEPDEGIYDAMNKGLAMASGEFVLFLNAGDLLYQSDTLQQLFAHNALEVDIFYGETMLVDENYQEIGTRSNCTTRKLPDSLNWRSFEEGMTVCHQSFIVRRNLAPKYILNNLTADIDWCIRCLKKSRVVVNTQQIIAAFLVGGTSQQQKKRSLLDRFRVMQQHYGLGKTLLLHFKILIRSCLNKLTL